LLSLPSLDFGQFLLKEVFKREPKDSRVVRKLAPSDFQMKAQETFSIEVGKKEG